MKQTLPYIVEQETSASAQEMTGKQLSKPTVPGTTVGTHDKRSKWDPRGPCLGVSWGRLIGYVHTQRGAIPPRRGGNLILRAPSVSVLYMWPGDNVRRCLLFIRQRQFFFFKIVKCFIELCLLLYSAQISSHKALKPMTPRSINGKCKNNKLRDSDMMVDATWVVFFFSFLATKETRQLYRFHTDTRRTCELHTGSGFEPTTLLLQTLLNANHFANYVFNNDS